jgi:hypothetical protein
MDRAIGAHRERGAQGRLNSGTAERNHDDLAGSLRLFQPQRLLERELVVGVENPGDARGSRVLPSAATSRGSRYYDLFGQTT